MPLDLKGPTSMVAISGGSKPKADASGCGSREEALGGREHRKAERVGGGGHKVRQVRRRWGGHGAENKRMAEIGRAHV